MRCLLLMSLRKTDNNGLYISIPFGVTSVSQLLAPR